MDGTVDASTGLTQLGARSYDADLGRFVSVDPVMDLTDAQQMHGYVYSNNNPATFTDPTGLLVDAWAIHAKKRIEYYGGSGTPGRSGSYGSSSGGNRPGYPASSRPPSVYTPPVSATNSPETDALNSAAQQDEASFWESAGSWFSDRYTTDNGGANWGNILGDAGLALGIAGMFACPVCGVLGAAGAAFSVGGGLWNFQQGNVGAGMWGLAGGIPVVGAAGVRAASAVRGANAQRQWWSSITTNNGVIRKRTKAHKWANRTLEATEASISRFSANANGMLGNVGAHISIGGVAYNEARAFRRKG